MQESLFSPIDDKWFEELFATLAITPKSPINTPSKPLHKKPLLKVDLRNRDFITLFDLLNLFLTIELSHSIFEKVEMHFTGLGPYEDEIMPIEKYNELRHSDRLNRASLFEKNQFTIAGKVYNILSFLYNFGFFNAIQPLRDRRLTCVGISDKLLQQLYTYRSTRIEGSRVMPLLPIRHIDDIQRLRIGSIVRSWLIALPPEVKEAPIFQDGEFSKVFGYQFGMNIIEHSGVSKEEEFEALGAIAMRVLPSEILPWINNSFPDNMANIFKKSKSKGILEMCVGDRGVGLVSTLKKSFDNLLKKYGQNINPSPRDVVAFAFDELGTSKQPDERWGGVHALHRILNCTVKYHGILRIRTSGYEFIYDAASQKGFTRSSSGFGLYTSDENVRRVNYPFGTQIQVLLPLTAPTKRFSVIPKRGRDYNPADSSGGKVKVISVAAYFHDLLIDVRKDDALKLRLTTLANSLMEEPVTKVIAYDFGVCDWTEEVFAYFLDSQEPVLHTHKCIGINLNTGLADQLRDRELLDPADETDARTVLSSFFEVLSTKHRLFPVLDIHDGLHWFGLGRYKLDQCLNEIFNSLKPVTKQELLESAGISDNSTATPEALDLYLQYNDQIFNSVESSHEIRWTCVLTKKEFDYALESLVRTKLPELMKSLSCIMDTRGLYKLPSRPFFADAFIYSTPLFQHQISILQISEWMASAIRRLLNEDQKEILLVSATAPAELFSRTIASALPEYKVYTLNLGYFSALDEENLINPGDWQIPAVIVADVVSAGHTVQKIEHVLQSRQIKIAGMVALMRFGDEGNRGEIRTTMFWDPLPGKEINVPRFFMAEMRRPQEIDQQIAELREQSDLFFVEPFSLKPYSYASLISTYDGLSLSNKENCKRLSLFEEAGVLRSGHWVYGSHHFRITFSVKKLLENDRIGGEICGNIIKLCKNEKIDHIIVPLHSHIGDLLPRISSGLKLVIGKQIDYSFCVSTRVLTKRPFYILPESLEEVIQNFSKYTKTDKQGLRLLILDDAIATGRTLETILRALILASRRARRNPSGVSPVESIYYYAIIDRQVKSRSTTWTSVRKLALGDISLQTPGEEPSLNFIFERWIDVDMPVDEKEDCEICEERRSLIALKDIISLPPDHSVQTEIESRIKELTPHSTEIPLFLSQDPKKLTRVIEFGRFKEIQTAELALWEFYNSIHRGTPYTILIKEYRKIFSFLDLDPDETKGKKSNDFLKCEMGRAIFRDWKRVVSHWGAIAWKDTFIPEIEKGSIVARQLLPEAGKALAVSSGRQAKGLLDREDEGKKSLKSLFLTALAKIASIDISVNGYLEQLENLFIGCALFCIYYQHYYKDIQGSFEQSEPSLFPADLIYKIEDEMSTPNISSYSQRFLQNLLNITRSVISSDNFLPALLTLLSHTIRSARHSHSYLLPFQIDLLSEGIKFTETEKQLLRNTLGEFIHNFDIVRERYDNLFDDDALALISILLPYMNELKSELGSNWPDNLPSSRAQELASTIYRIYPNQKANSIYTSLVSIHIQLGKVIDKIIHYCKERAIQFILSESSKHFTELSVITPNPKLLEKVLANFTYEARIDERYCKAPMIYLAINEKRERGGIKKIVLNIYTNFTTPNDAEQYLSTGSGLIEFGRSDYRLFGMKGNFIVNPDSPDGRNYTVSIWIELCKGFKLPT